MATVKEVITEAWDALGELYTETASGGAAGGATLVDSNFKSSDDEWDGGSIIIDYEPTATAATGNVRRISDSKYIEGTGTTFTPLSAFDAVIASGVVYSLATKRFPYDVIRRRLNAALRALGPIPLVDTSLSTASGTMEHSLPAGISAENIRRVFVSQTGSDADDRQLMENVSWFTTPEDKLIFRTEPFSGETIMLIYMGQHPWVWAEDDAISDQVNINLAVAALVYQLLRWERRGSGGETGTSAQDVNDARIEYENLLKKHAPMDPGKAPRLRYLADGRARKYGRHVIPSS